MVAVPSGVGAFLRLPYTFAIPIFGGRNWTTVSAALLVIPCLLLAWAVSHPSLPFAVLVFRILDEEKLLTQELSGYREYRQLVRYRLVPYVW
ncbi:integral membrane nitrite extrusion protein NARU (nitrite facilitator) [Mycobacterium tuberculosis]|nr:integral membrane nitrite extrusion protein NARU (nitrite facilitator) [Mycobacterium tuberculosis]